MADETFGFFSPREQSEQATQSYAVAKDGWKGMRDKETRGQSFVKSRPFVSLSRNYSRIHRKLEGFSARRASLFFFFSAFLPRVPQTRAHPLLAWLTSSPRMLMNIS